MSDVVALADLVGALTVAKPDVPVDVPIAKAPALIIGQTAGIVGADRCIDDFLSVLLGEPGDVGVVDDAGSVVGVVDRAAVVSLLAVDR